jgi:hypothetical protein
MAAPALGAPPRHLTCGLSFCRRSPRGGSSDSKLVRQPQLVDVESRFQLNLWGGCVFR